MKHNLLTVCLLSSLLLGAGCASKNDAPAVAEDANDQKIANNNAGGAAATATSSGDAEDVAKYLVDLASTGLTELDMSNMALERATVPAVKSYAQQVVDAHAEDDSKLKDLSSRYHITLPDGLSDEGQEMVMRLKYQDGTEFDRQYLDNMAAINDQASRVAKTLTNKTNKSDLKEFATKTEGDDAHHRDLAQQLKAQVK